MQCSQHLLSERLDKKSIPDTHRWDSSSASIRESFSTVTAKESLSAVAIGRVQQVSILQPTCACSGGGAGSCLVAPHDSDATASSGAFCKGMQLVKAWLCAAAAVFAAHSMLLQLAKCASAAACMLHTERLCSYMRLDEECDAVASYNDSSDMLTELAQFSFLSRAVFHSPWLRPGKRQFMLWPAAGEQLVVGRILS